MQKFLIVIGILFIVIGIGLPLLKKIGLGHLPGDFIIKRSNFIIYFPFTTALVISIILSIILWLMNR